MQRNPLPEGQGCGPTPAVRGKQASFRGLQASSAVASEVGRANLRENTRPERTLGRALRLLGLTYSHHDRKLPGRPDFVFGRDRAVVFCDGDFWHGRDWRRRRARLARGHNALYWMEKIAGNRDRDRHVERALTRLGWRSLRVWESDVLAEPMRVARRVAAFLRRGQSVELERGR